MTSSVHTFCTSSQCILWAQTKQSLHPSSTPLHPDHPQTPLLLLLCAPGRTLFPSAAVWSSLSVMAVPMMSVGVACVFSMFALRAFWAARSVCVHSLSSRTATPVLQNVKKNRDKKGAWIICRNVWDQRGCLKTLLCVRGIPRYAKTTLPLNRRIYLLTSPHLFSNCEHEPPFPQTTTAVLLLLQGVFSFREGGRTFLLDITETKGIALGYVWEPGCSVNNLLLKTKKHTPSSQSKYRAPWIPSFILTSVLFFLRVDVFLSFLFSSSLCTIALVSLFFFCIRTYFIWSGNCPCGQIYRGASSSL